jgi:hypothetical protein
MCRTVATSGNGDRGVGHVIRATEGRLGGPGNSDLAYRRVGMGLGNTWLASPGNRRSCEQDCGGDDRGALIIIEYGNEKHSVS